MTADVCYKSASSNQEDASRTILGEIQNCAGSEQVNVSPTLQERESDKCTGSEQEVATPTHQAQSARNCAGVEQEVGKIARSEQVIASPEVKTDRRASTGPDMIKSPMCLANRGSSESELIRRNREIAQVRDLLHRRELEIKDWKARHGELVGRLADLDGELNKSRARARRSSDSESSTEARISAARSTELELQKELQEERARAVDAIQKAELATTVREEALLEAGAARRDRNRAVEAASRRTSELELQADAARAEAQASKAESLRCSAEAEAAKSEVALLREMLERNQSEVAGAHAAMANSVSSAEVTQLQHDLQICRSELDDARAAAAAAEAFKEELHTVRSQLADAHAAAANAEAALGALKEEGQTVRSELSDARAAAADAEAMLATTKEELEAVRAESAIQLETAIAEAAQAVADLERQYAADNQMWKYTVAESKSRACSTERVDELESRLATERRSTAAQMVSLEEQLASERRSRHDAESKQLAISNELKEALQNLSATAARLEAAEAASLSQALESQAREQQVRRETTEMAERIVSQEEELRASFRYQARAKALQTECGGLRYEVGVLRREKLEMRECFAMVSEEARTRRLEAAADNTQLRVQLEETRRARSLDMHALIGKLSTPARAGARGRCTLPVPDK